MGNAATEACINLNGQAWSAFISPDRIVSLHDTGIRRYGGKPSPPRQDCIDGSIGGAYTAGLYTAKSDPPDPVAIALPFAGYLLFYLAKNSCFVDGNKRVAWTSAMEILYRFGLTLTATQEEAEELVLGVVEKRIDNGSDVVLWLEKHLTAITPNQDS